MTEQNRQIANGPYQLSRPSRDDAPAVLALLNACELATYQEAESTLEDVLGEWDDLDLARDVWLARAADGAVQGYVCVFPQGDRVNCDFYTLPDERWADLATQLLRAAEGRARELVAAGKGLQPKAFTVQDHVNPAAQAAAAACGYGVTSYHFQMGLRFDAAPSEPVWPQGVVVRNIQVGEDDRRLHAFIQRAFDRPGRVPQPFEAWQSYMMRPDHFRPDLWFLAEAGAADGAGAADSAGELVGAALCYEYPTQGWVRQLAVAEGWRRRGLGSALLRHAMQVFHRAGKPGMGLAVASANERAYRLYEAVGLHRERQYDEYEKSLAEA